MTVAEVFWLYKKVDVSMTFQELWHMIESLEYLLSKGKDVIYYKAGSRFNDDQELLKSLKKQAVILQEKMV